MIVSGAVSGLQVDARLGFRFLREGSGEPIEVVEADVSPLVGARPLVVWVPRADNPFEATLYRTDEGFLMWIPGMGGFEVEPQTRRLTVPAGVDPVRREARMWGVPTSLLVSERGDLPIHASSVEVDGRALLFCGPSRFGKTTLAAAFLAAGHRMLSEDLTCCRLEPEPAVLPGPALLRLRRDVHERLGPFVSTSVVAEDDDRIHLVLDGAHRGSADPVPLSGLVVLRRSATDIQLGEVEAARFLPELFSMSFALPTDADRARSFGAVVDLAGRVPVWVLDRPLRFGSLGEVIERLIDRCLG